MTLDQFGSGDFALAAIILVAAITMFPRFFFWSFIGFILLINPVTWLFLAPFYAAILGAVASVH